MSEQDFETFDVLTLSSILEDRLVNDGRQHSDSSVIVIFLEGF